MKKAYIRLIFALCVLIFVGSAAFAAGQVVKGTLTFIAGDAGSIGVAVGNETIIVKPAPAAKIFRGQVGKDMRIVELREFALGDSVEAFLNDKGLASSIKAYFGIIKGTFSKLQGNTLLLKDGRTVRLHPDARVSLTNGRSGGLTDLKKGDLLLCRLNPLDNQVWMVLVVTLVDPSKPAVKLPTHPKAAVNTPAPAAEKIEKPVIKSVKYSCPTPVKTGDQITVELTGTPGGNASFEVKHLISAVSMKETSSGLYQAVTKIPDGKPIQNAALVGYLSVKDVKASPVQASALLSINATPVAKIDKIAEITKEPEPTTAPLVKITPQPAETKPVVAVTPVAEPVAAAPQVVITPEKKPEPLKITITTPANGTKIKRALQVLGKAEPESKIMVEITYSNGFSGILKLSGTVASQQLAVGKNGEFKLGPLLLEGPLATKGLEFTIKSYYPDQTDHGTVITKVIGDRD